MTAERQLRLLLLFSGLVTWLSFGAFWVTERPAPSIPLLVLASIATGAVVVAALTRRLGPGRSAIATLPLLAGGSWLLMSTHRILASPQVDWITPLGIGPLKWIFLPSLLLILIGYRGVLSAGRPRRRPGAHNHVGLAMTCLIGCATYVAFWYPEQTFFEERVELLEQGEMAVAVGGTLEHHPWSRVLVVGRPIERVPDMIRNEWDRADLAHGMALEAGQRGKTLTVLWTAQKSLTAALLVVEGGLLAGAVLLAGLAISGIDPGYRPAAAAALYAVTMAVPVCNLTFTFTQLVSRLGDGDLGSSLPANLGYLIVTLGADLCGRVLAKG